MKQNISKLVFLFALVAIVSSCKDDDEKPSKTALLSAKAWSVTKYEILGVNVTEEYQDECDADNTTKFKSDGTFLDNVNSVKCEVDEENRQGAWSFKENETILSLHYDGDDAEDWKIVDLTSATLKLSQYDSDIEQDLVITLITK